MDASQLYRMLVFATVVEQGSFTKAADKLGVSRSMVSQHLKKLEKRLNNQLLQRTTRKLQLTLSGQGFYHHCAELLELARQAEKATLPKNTELQGSLKISLPTAIGQYLVLPKLAKFNRLYPKIRLNVQLDDTCPHLQDQQIDLAIHTKTESIPQLTSEVQEVKLARSQEVLVASPEYYSQYGNISQPDELPQHRWIFHTNQLLPKQLVINDTQGNGYHLRIMPSLVCNQPLSVIDLARFGLGIITINSHIVRNDLSKGKLIRILPEWHLNAGDLVLSHRFEAGMPPRALAFTEFIRKEVFPN